MRTLVVLAVAAVAVLLMPAPAFASPADTLVTVGSPPTPFSQNKQNEPAIAIDPTNPSIAVAGANDNIDEEACDAGAPNTCPFTPGIGVSGVYFSFTGGASWIQPTYTGLTARDCLGPAPCTPHVGPIGTVPGYYEEGLASDGDPAVAFGPVPGPNGFDWSNGSRLYYANLTANIPATRQGQAFPGFEAIGVARTDDIQGAAAGENSAWMAPVLISRQSSTTFSDKEQVWADNAASSRFFGTVYVCWASFRGQEKGNAAPAPLQVAVSHDGGSTWRQHQVTGAADNGQVNPADGCTIRTDSTGNAYLFGIGTSSSGGHNAFELMSVSSDGGGSWSPLRPVVGPVQRPGVFDPVQFSVVIDGIAGARADLASAPSVDIANGAPTGADATDRMVMSFVSGTTDQPQVIFAESTDHGQSWSTRSIGAPGDRGLYAAPAISPDGSDVYVVYNAFTTPFRTDTTSPRALVGVVMHADSSGGPTVPTGTFTELNRSLGGDPRASSANALDSEFLGDYVYAAATRSDVAAVWNDASAAEDCPAIDAYRSALEANDPNAVAPAPESDCPATFGNSDIRGGLFTDPTP